MGPWSPAPTPRASGLAPRTRRAPRHSTQRPISAHRPPTCPETRSEECPRDRQPHPGQDDRRGVVRRAEAQPRRGIQDHRPADPGARVPQGQGADADHRPACRPWCRAPGGGQRGAAALLRPGRRREQRAPARSAGGRRHRGARRGGPGPEVHRRGGRPPGARAARLHRPPGRGRPRAGGRRGGGRADHHPAPAVRHAQGRRPAGPGRRLRLDRPVRDDRRRGGRLGQRRLLRGRHQQHAGGHRRGPRRHDRGRDQGVLRSPRRRRP